MMRIVRELAAERNPVAKIAFLTRLPEAAVREALGLAAAAGAEVRGVPPATTGAPGITGVGAFIPLDERTGPPCQGTSRQPRSGWVIPPGTPCRTLAAQGARAAGVRASAPGSTGKGGSIGGPIRVLRQ